MSKQLFLMVLIIVFFTACERGKRKNITPELNVSALEIDTAIFRVRIFIPPELRERLSPKVIEDLIYRPDSSIYYRGKGDKTYPLYIEPVANANKYLIEYLVEFDIEKPANIELYYTDKYINHKTYPLKLK